jgi:hypothetical protein
MKGKFKVLCSVFFTLVICAALGIGYVYAASQWVPKTLPVYGTMTIGNSNDPNYNWSTSDRLTFDNTSGTVGEYFVSYMTTYCYNQGNMNISTWNVSVVNGNLPPGLLIMATSDVITPGNTSDISFYLYGYPTESGVFNLSGITVNLSPNNY